jgi:hypothetical protein
MAEYRVKVSPQLEILADVIGIDLEFIIKCCVITKLNECFRCGTEIEKQDIERNVKIEKLK